ncbi:unnamed protein product [Sphagnum jensenii]
MKNDTQAGTEGGREQQGETWEQASSQRKNDAGVRAACCTWPNLLRPMPWHQRFVFCRASTPRPRPGSGLPSSLSSDYAFSHVRPPRPPFV